MPAERWVSVLVAAYNHAAFIQETLDSIAAQDHPWVETVVVDDGSTDATADVVAAFARASRRPCHLIRQANAGPTKALERAFRASRGAFIVFCGSDDMLLPGRITHQLRLLDDTGADVAYGSCIVLQPDGSRAPAGVGPIIEALDRGELHRYHCEARQPPLKTQSAMVRRSLLEQIGGVDQGMRMDDWPLNIRFASPETQARIVIEDRPTFVYRVHGQNIYRNWALMLEWSEEIIQTLCPPAYRAAARANIYHGMAAGMMGTQTWQGLRYELKSQRQRPDLPRLAGMAFRAAYLSLPRAFRERKRAP